jgi:hypothetical protein
MFDFHAHDVDALPQLAISATPAHVIAPGIRRRFEAQGLVSLALAAQ